MEAAPELCALLQRYYDYAARGDSRILDELILRAPGTLVIGTDPGEWWSGGDEIVAIWSAAWGERGGLPVEGSAPRAFRLGDMGWAADQAMWRLPDGRAVPFRVTVVFERSESAWRIAHAHFSLGVANDAVAAADTR